MIRECSSVTSLNFLKSLKEIEPQKGIFTKKTILYNDRFVKSDNHLMCLKWNTVNGQNIVLLYIRSSFELAGGGGVLREIWVEVCRRGPQTPTLFKTKTSHFATLFKGGDTTFLPWFALFCIQNEVIFHTKIVEIDI